MSGEDLIAAAHLLRSHGYAVVTGNQRERWETLLRQAHDREHEQHGENIALYQDLSLAVGRLQELLGGSRPVWYRRLRRRWSDLGNYRAQAVPAEPKHL